VNRIAVVGPVASGKTTLAACLSARLLLPMFDLDDYYWRQAPQPTVEEWATTHGELVGREQWIISGDYRAVANARFTAADAVVWLDLPRSTCLRRATIRKLKGNPTPLADSWRWIWRYGNQGRHETATSLANPHLTCAVYRLRSSRDVSSFLSDIEP
jgi:adenylate kinase family enzyme